MCKSKRVVRTLLMRVFIRMSNIPLSKEAINFAFGVPVRKAVCNTKLICLIISLRGTFGNSENRILPSIRLIYLCNCLLLVSLSNCSIAISLDSTSAAKSGSILPVLKSCI
jgi:hypothetical protein